MAHALIRVLADRHAGVEIHVLAPPATRPLATRMAEVRASHELPVGHGELGLIRRWRMARTLRRLSFDTAYVLPNTLKSALVPAWAGIPRRVGWHGESRYGLLTDRRRLDRDRYPRMVERFLALAPRAGAPEVAPWPAPALTVDLDNRRRLIAELGLATAGGVLVLCPGAEYGPAKRWPVGHFAAVGRWAVEQGRQVWLLGSPADAAACDAVQRLLPEASNTAGRTRLPDAVDLLSAAAGVVCNDSGLMHVACAVGAPTVALFGSTSPRFTPPLSEGARVLDLDVPCGPCFQRICPFGHGRCLRDLAPQRAVDALSALWSEVP